MAFTAKKSDNSIAAVVNDYEATIVGGLQLLGYGYVNYSEEIANNFVKVAENFANTTPPASPLKGQLWWNTSGANPSLWVCRDPTAAASPITSRWSMIFEVNGATGNVDAWTLRGFAPSKTSVADTVVVRGTDGKIDAASLPSGLGATNLDALTDVVISSPVAAQVVRHNGTNWVNQAIGLNDIQNVDTTGAVAGSILKFNGSNWVIGTDVVGSGGGSSTWGSLTGTVTDQSDLVSYIAGRTWAMSSVTGLVADLATRLTLTSLKASDGAGSGIDSDLLDGQHGAYYLNRDNHTGTLPQSAFIPAYSYVENGYVKIGDFILQWGKSFINDTNGYQYFSLPITFPNAHLMAVGNTTSNLDGGDEGDESVWVKPNGVSQVAIGKDGDFSSTYVNWIAIGY